VDWPERFRAYSAEKERLASRADIPGFVTRIDHSREFSTEPVENAWTHARFDGAFHLSPLRADRVSTNLVFVQSRDGNTGADDPSALGAGDTDKHLIYEGLTRVAADAVLAGASTVRGAHLVFSVWHQELVALRLALGMPRHPLQVVITASGNIDIAGQLMFNLEELPVVVITSAIGASRMGASAADRPWVQLLDAGTPLDLGNAFDRIRQDHGVRRISAVGGRTTATALIDGRLVDDLYLTTSTAPGGETGTPFYVGPSTALRAGPGFAKRLCVMKEGRGAETGVRFEHFIVPFAH
jgi:riboflavin biosynthesis pyrimidine reductase